MVQTRKHPNRAAYSDAQPALCLVAHPFARGDGCERYKGQMDTYGPSIYAHEKLLGALESLATGPGDVRARLLTAYETFHPLTPSHFPLHLRKDFGWVLKQLKKREPIYDSKGRLVRGSVEETLRHIKNITGAKIATRIYRLYHALDADIRHNSVPSNPVPKRDGRKLKWRNEIPRAHEVGPKR